MIAILFAIKLFSIGYNHTKICGAARINCYNQALQRLGYDFKYLENCKCWFSCNSIEYSAKLDAIKFNASAVAEAAGSNANYSE